MPRCSALTGTYDQCTNAAWVGETMCRIHIRAHARYDERFGPHIPGMCAVVDSPNGRCENAHEPNQLLCMQHRHARERRIALREMEEEEERRIEETYQEYMAHNPLMRWQDVFDELANRAGLPIGFPGYVRWNVARGAAQLYFETEQVNPEQHNNILYFHRIWRWIRHGRHGPVPLPAAEMQGPVPHHPHPPPPQVPRLQALAQDQQNVHTREVSQQTNDSTRKLLEVVVPLQQKTEQTLMLSWYALPNAPAHYKILKVAIDINKWFNTETCREQGDKLYKHLLRGLVAYISQVHDAETKQELWRRAYQECDESVGMCCEGHITRLCNVLVGFDEAFQPPVPFAEILQNKMAAIFMMDVPTEEKIQHATTFFNEYAVPDEERHAWLDALSQD
jgi:hypothetical protein